MSGGSWSEARDEAGASVDRGVSCGAVLGAALAAVGRGVAHGVGGVRGRHPWRRRREASEARMAFCRSFRKASASMPSCSSASSYHFEMTWLDSGT